MKKVHGVKSRSLIMKNYVPGLFASLIPNNWEIV